MFEKRGGGLGVKVGGGGGSQIWHAVKGLGDGRSGRGGKILKSLRKTTRSRRKIRLKARGV